VTVFPLDPGQDRPVLPQRTDDDLDVGSGDLDVGSGDWADDVLDDDERLLRERPPHWE
jgi:hypothetical protein